MESFIQYLNNGYSTTDLLAAITVISAIIVSMTEGLQWLYKYFLFLYKRKKGAEEESITIDENTNEIKKLSESIDHLAALLNTQYEHLNQKIDEQKERLTLIDEEGKKRDCAILRDRILGGMRYFSQNKDKEGMIHISVSDHENMEQLFHSYFDCKGNGTVQVMYEKEFKTWIIDK